MAAKPGSAREAAPGAAWVVYLSGIPWRLYVQRQQELARQLARTRRVLFVEPPGLLPSWRLRGEPLGPSLWRLSPPTLLPAGRFLPPVNVVNRRFAAWCVRRWLDERPAPRLLWVDEDLAAPIIGRLGEVARVYDATDLDWTFTRRWNRPHLRRALASAVGQVDLILVSSPALSEALDVGGRRPVEVLNACDPDHFHPDGPEAAILASVPGPRIGCVGHIDERAFDAPLVASVARLRPEWSFVLVGEATGAASRPLRKIPNIHLLGPAHYADVPSLVRGFDVCLIPYRTDGRAAYVQPKKLYEYLAVGRPVVTTPLPGLLESDAPLHRAATAAEVVAAIEMALPEAGLPGEARRRRAVACRNSWDARGEQLRGLLDALEAEVA